MDPNRDWDGLLWRFCDAMANVASAINQQVERWQVEELFGLTGGELDDKPLKFRDEDGDDRTWRYHYDKWPEWAGEDFPDKYESGVDYFTLVEIGCSYESSAPEWLWAGDRFYLQVQQYSGDREVECSWRYSHERGDDNDKVGEGATAGMQRCPMCETAAGEEHGYIYLGTGCESVYKHVDIACESCGCTKPLGDDEVCCDDYLDAEEENADA